MGELADAIREHLELKRRRGANPAEVAREEHDALAPVTRSHPVVLSSPIEERRGVPEDPLAPGSAVLRQQHGAWQADEEEDVEEDGATQEFLVDHVRASFDDMP